VLDSIAVRRVWQQFSWLNPSVYSAALRGGCCVPPCVTDVSIVNCADCRSFVRSLRAWVQPTLDPSAETI